MKHAGVLFGAVALIALGFAVGCAINPVTGKRELSLVSSQQELQIGKDGYQAVLREYGAYDDAKLAAYVYTWDGESRRCRTYRSSTGTSRCSTTRS